MPKWVLLLAEMYANTWIQRIQQETLRSRLTPRRGWKSSSVICHTAKGSLGVSGRRRRRMLMVCSGGIAKRWTSLERDKPSKHQWLQAVRARRQHPTDGTHLLCFLDRVAWKSIPPPRSWRRYGRREPGPCFVCPSQAVEACAERWALKGLRFAPGGYIQVEQSMSVHHCQSCLGECQDTASAALMLFKREPSSSLQNIPARLQNTPPGLLFKKEEWSSCITG